MPIVLAYDCLPFMSRVLKVLVCSTVLSDEGDVQNHLELGKKFLQEGQLSEALMHYSAACGKKVEHRLYCILY